MLDSLLSRLLFLSSLTLTGNKNLRCSTVTLASVLDHRCVVAVATVLEDLSLMTEMMNAMVTAAVATANSNQETTSKLSVAPVLLSVEVHSNSQCIISSNLNSSICHTMVAINSHKIKLHLDNLTNQTNSQPLLNTVNLL